MSCCPRPAFTRCRKGRQPVARQSGHQANQAAQHPGNAGRHHHFHRRHGISARRGYAMVLSPAPTKRFIRPSRPAETKVVTEALTPEVDRGDQYQHGRPCPRTILKRALALATIPAFLLFWLRSMAELVDASGLKIPRFGNELCRFESGCPHQLANVFSCRVVAKILLYMPSQPPQPCASAIARSLVSIVKAGVREIISPNGRTQMPRSMQILAETVHAGLSIVKLHNANRALHAHIRQHPAIFGKVQGLSAASAQSL